AVAALGPLEPVHPRQRVEPAVPAPVEMQAGVEEAAVLLFADGKLVAEVADQVVAAGELLADRAEHRPEAVALALEDLRLAGVRLVHEAAHGQELVLDVADEGVLETDGNVQPAGVARAGVRV